MGSSTLLVCLRIFFVSQNEGVPIGNTLLKASVVSVFLLSARVFFTVKNVTCFFFLNSKYCYILVFC